jgi:cell division protein FtsN
MSIDSPKEKEDYLNFDFQPTQKAKTIRKFNGKKFLFLFIGFAGVVMISISFFMDQEASGDSDRPEVIAEVNQPETEPGLEIIKPVYSEKMDDMQEPVASVKDQASSTQKNEKDESDKSLKVDKANVQTNNPITPPKEDKKIPANVNDEKDVTHKYYLIAGSFGSEVNARSLVSQLQSSGYWALNLGKMGATYKVSIGSYETKSEADVARSQLLSKGIDTWVLQE